MSQHRLGVDCATELTSVNQWSGQSPLYAIRNTTGVNASDQTTDHKASFHAFSLSLVRGYTLSIKATM